MASHSGVSFASEMRDARVGRTFRFGRACAACPSGGAGRRAEPGVLSWRFFLGIVKLSEDMVAVYERTSGLPVTTVVIIAD